MIWLTWRQFRVQARVMFAILAVMAAVLAVSGMRLARLYDGSGLPACRAQADCGTAAVSFLTQLKADLPVGGVFYLGAALLWIIPAVIGLFWGAPLATREIEAGTFRLAWTQSVTRGRWLGAKLGLIGLTAMACAGLLSFMATWWDSPVFQAADLAVTRTGSVSMNRLVPLLFGASGVAPVGYAAFAFMLGVTAGALVRRVVPGIATTLVGFAAVQIAWPIWVRPRLIAPLTSVGALTPADVNGMRVADNGQAALFTGAHIPGAWILSSQVTHAGGQPFTGPMPHACMNGTQQACNVGLGKLHLLQVVTYQPASRYWEFQWSETAIFLGLALALAGFCFWWIRRRLA